MEVPLSNASVSSFRGPGIESNRDLPGDRQGHDSPLSYANSVSTVCINIFFNFITVLTKGTGSGDGIQIF